MQKAIVNNKYFEHFMTLSEHDLIDEVKEAVDNKNSSEDDKLEILMTALRVGLNPNFTCGDADCERGNSLLLHHLILKNETRMVIELIKNGVDIHSKSFGDVSVLHACAQVGNKQLMKYFIEKGADINATNFKKNTPLLLACRFSNSECFKLLLDKNPKISHKNLRGDTVFTLAIIKINITSTSHEYGEMLTILKMIIGQKTKIKPEEIGCINSLIDYGNDNVEAIEIIINKFPDILNFPLDSGNTILHKALINGKNNFLTIIMKKSIMQMIDWEAQNKLGASYLHLLSANCYINEIQRVVTLCPNIVKKLTVRGETAIDYVLLGKDIIKVPVDSPEEIISTIKFLKLAGVNINNKNKYNVSTISLSIKLHGLNIVQSLIDLGADVSEPRTNSELFPSINNGDLLGLCAELGKCDIMRLLIDHAYLNLEYIQDIHQKIPTALILATMNLRSDIITFLLGENKIKQFVKKSTKKYLLKVALEAGCVEKNLLINFASEDVVNDLNLDNDFLVKNYYENFIRRYIDGYDDLKKFILVNLKSLLSIFNRIFTLQSKKDIYVIFDETEQLYDNIAPHTKFVEILLSVIGYRIDHTNINEIGKYIETIKDLQSRLHGSDHDENSGYYCTCFSIDKAKDELVKLKTLLPDVVINKIKPFLNAVIALLKRETRFVKNHTNDIVLQLPDSESSDEIIKNDKSKVKRMLFKLLWPSKKEYYDAMVTLLSNDAKITYYDDALTVTTQNSITSIVRRLNNKKKSYKILDKPSVWFKFYAQNIGSKTDVNHMFSFALDDKLFDWPCIEIKAVDPTAFNSESDDRCDNFDYLDHFIYFPGELKFDNEIVKGCYEYFINSRGTLFHRMFRPHDSLPLSVKNLLS